MSLGASVQIVVDGIVAATERREWGTIQRLGERVRMIILDATADRDRGGLSEVASALEMAEAVFPASDEDAELARVAWMLRMDASLAKLAARRIPAKSTTSVETDRSARDRMLRALADANTAPSVAMIAKMSGLARETVSRLLPVMASEGLVRYRKVGRKTLTRITVKGRAAMGDKTVDIANSIRNFHAVDIKLVLTSSSDVQKRARRMVDWHAKHHAEIDVDVGRNWLEGFAQSHEDVIGLCGDPVLPAKVEALKMIANDGIRTGRGRVMEIPA